jgi:hypothetical protein
VIPLPELVDTMAAHYAPPVGHFAVQQQTAGIAWAIRQVGDFDIVDCRGSDDLRDWWIDGISEGSRAVPGYPSLGLVPYGFGIGLVPAHEAICQALRPLAKLAYSGHSLGGAHAAELAAMAILDDLPVAQVALCGCPKPGMIHLVTLVKSSGVPVTSLRNGPDPVPEVPEPFAPWLEWRDLVPFTAINEAPDPNAPPTILSKISPDAEWHSIALYQKGARALG